LILILIQTPILGHSTDNVGEMADSFENKWNQLIENRKKDTTNAMDTFFQDPTISENLIYCFMTPDGSVFGPEANKSVKLASISKVFTSLAILNAIKTNKGTNNPQLFQFKTVVEIYETKIGQNQSKIRLFIKGAGDPFFDLKKMVLLLIGLNKNKVLRIEEIVATNDFWIFPRYKSSYFRDPESPFYEGPFLPDTQKSHDNIMKFFNTPTFPEMKSIFKAIKLKTKDIRFSNLFNLKQNELPPFLQTNSVTVQDQFVKSSNEKLIHVIEIKSAPLKNIIKFMNTDSHNWIAEAFYRYINKEKISAFETQLKQVFHRNNLDLHFYSGSGLPLMKAATSGDSTKQRINNKASCSLIVEAHQKLLEIENPILSIPNVLPSLNNNFIPLDFLAELGRGTLKKYREVSQSIIKNELFFVGKTGTTNDALNLSLTAPTSSGNIHVFFSSNLPHEYYFRSKFHDNKYDQKLRLFQTEVKRMFIDSYHHIFFNIYPYILPNLVSTSEDAFFQELHNVEDQADFYNVSNLESKSF
jgi:hypothetical protein